PPPVAREALLAEAAPLSLGRMRLTLHPGPDGVLGLEAVAGQVDPDDVFPAWDRAAELAPFVMGGGLGPHKWADRAARERVWATPSAASPRRCAAHGSASAAATAAPTRSLHGRQRGRASSRTPTPAARGECASSRGPPKPRSQPGRRSTTTTLPRARAI